LRDLSFSYSSGMRKVLAYISKRSAEGRLASGIRARASRNESTNSIGIRTGGEQLA
jgi:hypothetical protein